MVLIGFMGSGKTSVGQQLAAELGLEFADTDAEVERVTGLSVADIFARYGEARFRAEEALAVGRLAGRPGLVIATGGGTVLDPANVAALRRTGRLFWLDVTPATVLRRVRRRESRPLLRRRSPQEVARLWAERRPFYEAAADFRVDTDHLSVPEVVAAVCKLLAEEGREPRCGK